MLQIVAYIEDYIVHNIAYELVVELEYFAVDTYYIHSSFVVHYMQVSHFEQVVLHVELVEQLHGHAGVLGSYEVAVLEGLKRAWAYVP